MNLLFGYQWLRLVIICLMFGNLVVGSLVHWSELTLLDLCAFFTG
jgi:hypothetical protein